MRRYRTKRNVLEVSLFPFLAVLICTLGVLIVMLVLAVKAADSTASEAVASEQHQHQSRRDELQSALEFEQLRVDGLTSIRPDSVQRLTEIRTLRGHLQQEIRELDSESGLLAAQMNALIRQKRERDNGRQRAAEDHRQAEFNIAQVRDQIDEAKKKLEDVQAKSLAEGPTKYSIVPHPGPGGTFRRPIYIECTRTGLVIQPFGIVLDNTDLHEPFLPGNPLDSALLAVREYWQRNDLAGSEGQPYPLLVVRPDGASSYTAARHAMRSWDDEFGYELIDADKDLEFGNPDGKLREEIETAIAQSRIRQEHAIASLQSTGGSYTGRSVIGSGRRGSQTYGDKRPGLVVSGNSGGFVASGYQPPSGSGQAGSQTRLASASMDGDRDRQVSFASGSPNNGSGQPGTTSNGPGQPSVNSTAAQNASQSAARSGSFAGSPGADGNISAQLPESGSTETEPSDASADSNAASRSSCDCLADSRGDQWALPSRTSGATAYLRPVRITCDANALTVRSAGQTDLVIPFEGETETAVSPLVESVWQMIDSWGPAGNDAYWKPELRISVIRGGEARVADLNRLLGRSGIVVQKEIR